MTENRLRRVVILGSTGSIGRQAVDVIEAHPELFTCVGLVAGTDGEGLVRQAAELGVERIGLGSDAAVELAAAPDADIVLNAVVGAAGLRASLAALEAGHDLALANKESLVAGGDLCLAAAAKTGAKILPVDSEHAALAQCLEGCDRDEIQRVIITASGGPFRTRRDLSNVTPDEALAHPTWSMGRKITTDSATLMNKGLEVIEAHYLFGFPYEQIDVLVHPQSSVHAIVELQDGSMLMQAGPADMRLAIAAALAHPARLGPPNERLDLAKLGTLEFEEVDHERFPALGLARKAGSQGRTYPAVLNAANEIAVAAFLDGGLSFEGITQVVTAVLDDHQPRNASSLDIVLEVDSWARRKAEEKIGARVTREAENA